MNKGVGTLNNSSDERRLSELMRKAQNGDSDSYRILLLEMDKMISSFVKNSFHRLGLAHSNAWEDVTQEILLGLHTKRATYDPNQYFLPWFYSIARYKIIDHARAVRTASRFMDLELDLVELEMNQTQMDESEVNQDLQTLFEGLPEKQRKVLELVKVQGLTMAEAAVRTGYGQSDIKVTVHRAIKSLQKRLRLKEGKDQ